MHPLYIFLAKLFDATNIFFFLLNQLQKNSYIIDLFINFLVACGTIGAIFVALFQDRIRYSTFSGPNFSIDFEEEPICYSIKKGILRFAYFVRVTNIGIASSKNTKCELYRVISQENGINRGFLEPRYLPWHIKPKKNKIKLDLSPGEERLIRFVFLQEDYPNAIFIADNLFSKGVADRINYIHPHSEDFLDKVEINLVIYCDNGKRKSFSLFLAIQDSDIDPEIKFLINTTN